MATNQTDRQDTQSDGPAPRPQRRGFFVAAAALVAGLVAKVTEQRVEAGVDGDVVLGAVGAVNTATTTTRVTNSSADSDALEGQCLAGTLGVGLYGWGSFAGVIGNQGTAGSTPHPAGAGVFGANYQAAGYGVLGVNDSPGTPSVGVRGNSSSSDKGIGVFGQGRGNGVFGQTTPGSTANGIAIYGLNNSSYTGPGPGAGGFGVYGLSANGHGLVGATAAAGAAAVVGATNDVAGAYAAAFYGPVIVSGAFTVLGGPKSAAVPHPDGTLRRLYCVESPESWFEDFGTGQLACGRAEVSIDPDFAAVVDLQEYHVFLTPYDHDHLLHVTDRSAHGFTVKADVGLAALKGHAQDQLAGSFSWRIVAKRKDIAGTRFDAVTLPAEPTLPPVPDLPPPPTLPRRT